MLETQNSPLFFLLLFPESLMFLNKSSPLSLFPCHWEYFEHKSAGSSCLQGERASSVSKFQGTEDASPLPVSLLSPSWCFPFSSLCYLVTQVLSENHLSG